MKRRWLVNRTNADFVSYLARSASISPILAQILINRGIKSASAAADFLNPSTGGFSDPYTMPDMQQAIERIIHARKNAELVLVHGDYDADGVTATAIMVQALRTCGMRAEYFIPNRIAHGYGFNQAGVDRAKELGAKLLLTVDCGITSFAAASAAASAGIGVIITDHHEPVPSDRGPVSGGLVRGSFIVPEALAVINPKLRQEISSQAQLAGAGVAFKFAHAMALEKNLPFSEENLLELMDLAALGTVADVVPLAGENRILIKEGVKHLDAASRAGIKALKAVAGLEGKPLRAGLLAFTMVPRINAAGRVADSHDVVRMLLTEQEDEAMRLGVWLDGLNSERQKIEGGVYQEARSLLDPAALDPVIVLSGEGWHPGVLGIVASRISDEFARPVFVFSIHEGVAKGSARSIPSFDICSGLAGCSRLLLGFGGHRQAAGVRLQAELLPEFKSAINRSFMESVTADSLLPSLEIDADVQLASVTQALASEIEQLEPFGYGNPEPLLGARSLEVINPKIVGNNHLKMKLRGSSPAIDSIAFDMGISYGALNSPERIDAVFTPSINLWNGGRYLQLVVRALRPSA